MTLPLEILRQAWWRQPSFLMMLTLGLSLMLYPFTDEARDLRNAAHFMDIVAVLLIGRLLRKQALLWHSGWILAIPLVLLQATMLFVSTHALELAMRCAQLVFHLYAVVALMSYVLSDDVITLDELFALASVYVLLALLWATAYALVVMFDPQAIFINSSNNPKNYVSFADLVYFSMTTLTSTGYGEITPVSPAARALAMLQQWVGVLFVAMLIARLTSLYKPSARG